MKLKTIRNGLLYSYCQKKYLASNLIWANKALCFGMGRKDLFEDFEIEAVSFLHEDSPDAIFKKRVYEHTMLLPHHVKRNK